jgi:hypothetical protein
MVKKVHLCVGHDPIGLSYLWPFSFVPVEEISKAIKKGEPRKGDAADR